MIYIQCAVCEKKEKTKVLYKSTFSSKNIDSKIFSARRTPDRLHHRFVQCSNCGLIFSNPILPPEKIIKLYTQSTFDYSLEAECLKKTYGYYLQKLLKNKNKSAINLLDVGCGNGFFLEAAREMGIGHLSGVEPGRESVKKAPNWLQKKIKIGILKKGIFKSKSFDVVCCFHTLDHIVNPNIFLQEVFSLLKVGGMALFIVHNTDGLSVKLFGERSPIFDIEHVYLFNKKNLPQLFIKNKFSVIKTFDVKNRYPLSYWVRMSPIPKIIKHILLQILNISKFGNIPIALNAGNIGIIVEK